MKMSSYSCPHSVGWAFWRGLGYTERLSPHLKPYMFLHNPRPAFVGQPAEAKGTAKGSDGSRDSGGEGGLTSLSHHFLGLRVRERPVWAAPCLGNVSSKFFQNNHEKEVMDTHVQWVRHRHNTRLCHPKLSVGTWEQTSTSSTWPHYLEDGKKNPFDLF